jgi:hypothetical protein
MSNESSITYCEIISDDTYDYRVIIVESLYHKLLEEEEWRNIGIILSPGWEHISWFNSYPNNLLFRKQKKQEIKQLLLKINPLKLVGIYEIINTSSLKI